MHDDDGLVLVTPWYPSPVQPYGGVFVRQWLASLRHDPERTTVIHLSAVPFEVDEPRVEVTRRETDLGRVVVVPYTVPRRTNRSAAALVARAALARDAADLIASADVVHAHVGLPAAVAVTPFVPAGIPFITIEHASYLARALQEPASRVMYSQMLARSDQHLTVGELEARKLRRMLPEHAAKVTAVGNPVSGDLFPMRAAPVQRLDRWLYVGNVLEAKGVGDVIGAFAELRQRRPDRDSTLRIVGQGLDRERFVSLSADLGVADRVSFVGSVTPEELAGAFAASDVLVHLSHGETFGLSMVEAAISGLPVVASRCGGPEETLRFAVAVGVAAFVDVRAPASSVVAAIERLERGLTSARFKDARGQLLHRFGMDDFGHRLRALSSKVPRLENDGVPHKALVIATGVEGAREAMHINQTLNRAGSTVRYVTAEPLDAMVTDRRIDTRSLWPRLRYSPLRAIERLLYGVPTFAIRSLQFAFRRVTHIGGPVGKLSSRAYWLSVRARVKWEHITERVHDRVFDRHIYQAASGRALARYALTSWPDLRADAPDLIVCCDPKSTYLARLLARELPDAMVISRPAEDELDTLAHARGGLGR